MFFFKTLFCSYSIFMFLFSFLFELYFDLSFLCYVHRHNVFLELYYICSEAFLYVFFGALLFGRGPGGRVWGRVWVEGRGGMGYCLRNVLGSGPGGESA